MTDDNTNDSSIDSVRNIIGNNSADNNVSVEEPHVSQNYRYCCDVYKVMAEEANNVNVDNGDGNPTPIMLWEGFFTKLIVDRLGLSVPYYSTLRRELMRMGCIRQLRRGGGSSPSQWEILREPTEDLWHYSPARKTYNQSKQEASLQQTADLARRIARLEENFDVLVRAFVDHGGRVPFDEPKRQQELGPKEYEVIAE